MLRIGLTGGIGSGKSTVAGRLAEHGAVVIDSDRIAREVVLPGSDGLAEVVAAFGDSVLAADGTLDRAALAAIVFADPADRARLNAILHPRIGARTAELTAQAGPDTTLVHDVPLLVENGMAPLYHLVIVVDAPVETRVRRLVGSRGLAEADAQARIAAQATEADRRAVADVWLDNGGAQDEVLAAVDELWADRLVRFEANLRLHRHTPRGAPHLVPADPTWPAQAARAIARIAMATGERAVRIEHIGSTSVPGLAAKDVLDLQLTVRDLADADAMADALATAGFPLLPGFEADAFPLAGGKVEATKRTHVGADPARWINLHLRVADSPAARWPPLFAAWLRADDAARDEYELLKRDLADRHTSIPEYADAKDSWMTQAAERAERWSESTGWTY